MVFEHEVHCICLKQNKIQPYAIVSEKLLIGTGTIKIRNKIFCCGNDSIDSLANEPV